MRTITSKKHGIDVAATDINIFKSEVKGSYNIVAEVSIGHYGGNYDFDTEYFGDSCGFTYEGKTTHEDMYNNRDNFDYLVEHLDADDVVDYYHNNEDTL